MTDAELQERVEAAHAKRYPNGCGQSWATSCEACCERLGANPPGPVFTLRQEGSLGWVAYLGLIRVAARPNQDAAYQAAVHVQQMRRQ